MNPIILSANLLEGYSTLTATDTDDGYDVLNVIDRRPYTWWQAGNVTTRTKYITFDSGVGAPSADTIGIRGHNLYTAGASLAVEYSTDGVSWSTALAGFAVASDKAVLKTFTSASKRYWRIKVYREGSDFTVQPKIAVLILGVRMEFPTPPEAQYTPNPEEVIATSNRGRTGHLLGSTLAFVNNRITAQFKQLTTTWVSATYYPWFVVYGRGMLPFFYAWNLTAEAASVHYVKLVDNPRFADPRTRAGFVDAITLEMEGPAE